MSGPGTRWVAPTLLDLARIRNSPLQRHPYSLRSGVAQGWPSSRQIADNERPGVEHPNPGAVRRPDAAAKRRSQRDQQEIRAFHRIDLDDRPRHGLGFIGGGSSRRRVRLGPTSSSSCPTTRDMATSAIHGNPRIRTPNLDRFARESVRLKTFCVSPVCSPTRASLLTGRYNYRTGVVDTYSGTLPDARRRDDARGGAGSGRLSHRDLRQVAPRRQRPDAGRSTRASSRRWSSREAGSARPPTRRAARATSTRSSRRTAGRGR